MKILHTSDLHGQYEGLLRLLSGEVFDLWVDTGDFFPNRTRGDREIEVPYQAKWFEWKRLGSRLVEALEDVPLVCVSGNHDYVDLAGLIREAEGVAYNVSDGPAVVGGLSFSGFREIPWMGGEWNGEAHDFTPLVKKTLEEDPDVLVTHSPPGGILDKSTDGHPCGVNALTSQLTYTQHKVRAHLFGHIHEQGGLMVEDLEIKFSNAATGFNVLYL